MRNLGLRLIHVHTASISGGARLPDSRGTWTHTRSRRLTTSPKCSAGRASTRADVSSNCSMRSTKNQQDRSRTRERLDSSGCSEAISMLVIRLRQAASQVSRAALCVRRVVLFLLTRGRRDSARWTTAPPAGAASSVHDAEVVATTSLSVEPRGAYPACLITCALRDCIRRDLHPQLERCLHA